MAGNPFAPPSGGKSGGADKEAKQGAIARRIAGKSGGKSASAPGQPSVNSKSMPPSKPNLAFQPGMFGG